MNEETNGKEHKGGVIARSQLYSVASAHSKEAIETLAHLMRNSRNEGIRLGAARALLDKALPDLKAMEVKGDEGGPLRITITTGNGFTPTPATGFAGGSAQIQSISLASESTEDVDGFKRIS